MHLPLSRTLPLLIFTIYTTTSAQATLCTSTNATPFESLQSDSSGSDNSSSDSGTSGSVDPEFELEQNDFLNEFQGNVNAGTVAGGNSFLSAAGGKLKRRDDLSCTATEYCMSLDNVPLCVDGLSGDYHVDGEHGNLVTGDYTTDSGVTGNLYTGEQESATTTTSESATTTASDGAATTSVAKSSGSETVTAKSTSASGGSVTQSATTSTPTPNTAVGRMSGGGLSGAVILGMAGMLML